MRLIPVLDVMNGAVVRGIGGRRSEYRPIVSRLTSSTDPVNVARALVETYHPLELYLADLDSIQGSPPAGSLYRAISRLGVQVWVDAGIRDGPTARLVTDANCDVVAGLETVPNPEVLMEIVKTVGSERVIFSLDLKDGVPLREWPPGSAAILAASPSGQKELARQGSSGSGQDDRAPRRLAAQALECGISRLIILDLARVGGGTGTGTDDLCREITSAYPQVELIAGGGVAGPSDLQRLEACGVQGVLVASALHDGRISAEYTVPST